MTEKRVLFIRWHEVALQDHPEVIFKLNEKSAQAIKPFLAN
jgi:hypothetical protein